MYLATRKSTSIEVTMDDQGNKVDIWEHQNLREEVRKLQYELDKLRKDFNDLRDRLTGDGK
jgi:archaellum component FlaC